MAKVTVIGNAVVLTSTMKYDEIKMVGKYRPESLVLKDEDGEQVFAVAVTNGNGTVGKWGAEFGGKTHDENGYATITMISDFDEDIKEHLVDALGDVIKKIGEIEKKFPEIIREIEADRAAVAEAIEIQ